MWPKATLELNGLQMPVVVVTCPCRPRSKQCKCRFADERIAHFARLGNNTVPRGHWPTLKTSPQAARTTAHERTSLKMMRPLLKTWHTNIITRAGGLSRCSRPQSAVEKSDEGFARADDGATALASSRRRPPAARNIRMASADPPAGGALCRPTSRASAPPNVELVRVNGPSPWRDAVREGRM